MNNLTAFLSVLVFPNLSLSFISVSIPETVKIEENNIVLYSIVGVSAFLIILFVVFALQSVTKRFSQGK